VDEEPEGIFTELQNDTSTCSEAGKSSKIFTRHLELKVHQEILLAVSQAKKEREHQVKTNPIYIRYVRDSTIFFNS
jgi:hypothetical protein